MYEPSFYEEFVEFEPSYHNSVFYYEAIKDGKLCVTCSLQFLTHWQNSALNSFVLFVYISYCIGTS